MFHLRFYLKANNTIKQHAEVEYVAYATTKIKKNASQSLTFS